jgi:dCTP deaminase
MILSDFELKHMISSKRLIVEPLSEDTIQQNGIDLKISNEVAMGIKRNDAECMDATSNEDIKRFYEIIKSEDGSLILSPLRHYLLSTQEHLELPNDLMGFCGLRSTFARLGFVSPLTIIDAGFSGTLTIESFYGGGGSIKIPVGCRFLHVVFAKLTTQVDAPYRGHYQHQRGIKLPKAVT